MIIPEILYNHDQEDQSLQGYIDAYDSCSNLIMEKINNGQVSHLGFLDSDVDTAFLLCFKIEISLRMIQIIEKHCDEDYELKIS